MMNLKEKKNLEKPMVLTFLIEGSLLPYNMLKRFFPKLFNESMNSSSSGEVEMQIGRTEDNPMTAAAASLGSSSTDKRGSSKLGLGDFTEAYLNNGDVGTGSEPRLYTWGRYFITTFLTTSPPLYPLTIFTVYLCFLYLLI